MAALHPGDDDQFWVVRIPRNSKPYLCDGKAPTFGTIRYFFMAGFVIGLWVGALAVTLLVGGQL